jgi:hypothetical protein
MAISPADNRSQEGACGFFPAVPAAMFRSFIALRSVSTDGTFASLPDSSANILQENPAMPCGCNSRPSMKTDGDPLSVNAEA